MIESNQGISLQSIENRHGADDGINEIMFESLVEKIIVINQNELEFHLYGGLKFTERLV